jgi:arylsulfatase A-like enzyme
MYYYALYFLISIGCFILYNKIQVNLIYFPGIIYKLNNPIFPYKEINWLRKSIESLQNPKKTKNPNIILIICDDLGINDLSADITPNIVSIYKNGLNFINAYASHATCSPSRASILTGKFPSNLGFEYTPIPKNMIHLSYYLDRHPIRNPIINFDNLKQLPSMERMVLPLNYSLISNELLKHNYYNYFLGKWHIGQVIGYTPLDRGYNESLSFLYGASRYTNLTATNIVSYINNESYLDSFLNANLPFSISYNNGPSFEPNEYMTDFLSNNAVKIIKSNENMSDSFFITLSYNAPHNPYHALIDDYNSLHYTNKTHIEKIYYAMIKAVDRGIGKIMDVLRETNQYDNTIVIFTSDNGGAHYSMVNDINKPYKGWKSTFFEGGIRIPLFIQYPLLIDKPTTITNTVHHVDIFKTILDLVNNNHSLLSTDGNNLFNYSSNHKILFWKSGNYISIRYGFWKLSFSTNPPKYWMYNLFTDPTEQTNIYDILNSNNSYINNKFLKMKTKLFEYNKSAKTTLWMSSIEVPIPINNNVIHSLNDEYVYWAN